MDASENKTCGDSMPFIFEVFQQSPPSSLDDMLEGILAVWIGLVKECLQIFKKNLRDKSPERWMVL
jgi:hypothetical protein